MLLELGESCARIPWWQDADISWPPREGKYRMKSTIFKSAVISLAPHPHFQTKYEVAKASSKKGKGHLPEIDNWEFPRSNWRIPKQEKKQYNSADKTEPSDTHFLAYAIHCMMFSDYIFVNM